MKFKYQVNNIIIIVICSLMSGCITSGTQGGNTKTKDIPTHLKNSSAPVKNVSQISHLEQCNRDLESLRTVSPTEYHTYLARYDTLMKNSADFMAVKDDVSPEVTELARPKFQFALVNLCYSIKNALAQTLINQAGGTR